MGDPENKIGGCIRLGYIIEKGDGDCIKVE